MKGRAQRLIAAMLLAAGTLSSGHPALSAAQGSAAPPASQNLPPGSRPPSGAPVPQLPPSSNPPPAPPPAPPTPAPGQTPPPPAATPPPAGAPQPAPPGTPGGPPAGQPAPPAGTAPAGGEAAAGGQPARARTEVRLSLNEAIQWVIQKSLTVEIERLNRDISDRQVVIAAATFDPFFNLSATYAKNRDPSSNVIDFGIPGVTSPSFGVRVNPSDTATFKSGVRGLSPIGTSYQLSLVESRFNSPAARIFAINPRYSSAAQAIVSQPLLKDAGYAYNTINLRIAQNNLQLSREQLALAAINTVYDVETAYWNLVFARKNFESKGRALAVAQEELRIDQKKAEVGTKAQIDVVTSEAQVARRKTDHDQAEALLEDARDQLLSRMNYVGVEESLKDLWQKPKPDRPYRAYQDLSVIPTTEPSTDPMKLDRSQSIEEAFATRVEYRQADLRIRNQDLAITSTKNQLLPSLDLNASWYQLGLDRSFSSSTGRVVDGDFYDWTVGAVFEIPISQRGPRAQYRNARDLYQRLKVEKQNLENSIVVEVDKAIRDLEFAHRAVENFAQQVTYQNRLLSAERSRLEVGKSIAYTVAQIENDLVAIEALDLRARADYEIAKATYRRAVGAILRQAGIELGQ